MDALRKKVLVLVLGLYGSGVALTWAGVGVVIPWSLHVLTVGVVGWLFGPPFWSAVGRANGQAGDGGGNGP